MSDTTSGTAATLSEVTSGYDPQRSTGSLGWASVPMSSAFAWPKIKENSGETMNPR